MANVQKREHGREGDGSTAFQVSADVQRVPSQLGESGIFELGDERPGAPRVTPAQLDPLRQAFGEVRSLNAQLQGANDALHAVNETLRTRVDQLRRTTLDLEQILNGLEVGLVLLDEELMLRHFNVMAAHFLGLHEPDLGGSIRATCRGLGPQLAEWCRQVLRSGKRMRRTLPSVMGEPLCLQLRLTRVEGERRLILVLAETTGPQQ